MERSVEGGDGGFRWWAGASAAQLALGIYSYRRGLSGECGFMPIRAFGVASLYVGALASASIGAIRFCGIHSVADAKEVGENIRTGLGIRPRF